jgi:hypothetical protein
MRVKEITSSAYASECVEMHDIVFDVLHSL